jgi:hypothetical protein
MLIRSHHRGKLKPGAGRDVPHVNLTPSFTLTTSSHHRVAIPPSPPLANCTPALAALQPIRWGKNRDADPADDPSTRAGAGPPRRLSSLRTWTTGVVTCRGMAPMPLPRGNAPSLRGVASAERHALHPRGACLAARCCRRSRVKGFMIDQSSSQQLCMRSLIEPHPRD